VLVLFTAVVLHQGAPSFFMPIESARPDIADGRIVQEKSILTGWLSDSLDSHSDVSLGDAIDH
jgi:hypothetical protein